MKIRFLLKGIIALGAVFVLVPTTIAQQLHTRWGAFMNVSDGATLKINQMNLVTDGAVNNQGRIDISGGNLINNAHFFNADTVALTGDFTGGFNFFNFSPASVWFNGNTPSVINGELNAWQLVMNKSNAKAVCMGYIQVADALHFFQNTGNYLELGGFSLTMPPQATVTGSGAYAFVVTNGTGLMYKAPAFSGTFTFPVGYHTGQYTPITVTQSGDPDGLGVRCLEHVLTEGNVGDVVTTGAVDASWEVSEFFPGGSILDVTLQWNPSDELPLFSAADCGVARHHSSTDWDLPPAQFGAASGASSRTKSRTGITPGTFIVSGEGRMDRVKLSPKIMLQGPFNTATGKMNDALRSLGAFPLTAPAVFGTGKFQHYGRQPAGGYAIAPGVLAVTGDDAIVDWVFVWLKSPSNPSTTLQTTLGLLQRDGDVVDMDGISPLSLPGSEGQYLLGIGHRNHLSVRMPDGGGLTLTEHSTTLYDFTSENSAAYGMTPMAQVSSSPAVFALRGGNVNGNSSVRATGPSSINDYSALLNALGGASNIITGVYHAADLNMDGNVRATGPSSINDYSRLLNMLGGASAIFNEQF